ncbi:MAG: hypothetical protein ABIA74_00630 [bacterium]
MQKLIFAIIFLLTQITSFKLIYSDINSKSNSSKITLNTGTTLSIKNEISNYTGTIEKEENSTITGSNINFNEGSLKESGNKINITGALEQTGKILLNGNKSLRSKEGKVYQQIEVSAQNNKIEGNILTENDILILDENASVTLAITNKLPVNIQLGNGTIYLLEDLNFLDGKKIIGSTKSASEGIIEPIGGVSIILNAEELEWEKDIHFGRRTTLVFNSNVKLSASWTFGGRSNHVIEGNNNILFLEDLGQINIDSNSQLFIRNLTINGLSGTNIKCLYDNAQITFQNVQIILFDNYSFQTGAFQAQDYLALSGPYQFNYQSNQVSTVKAETTLILDENITFSYDPGIASKNLIALEDSTSTLQINNATLHTTMTGLQLKTGKLLINNNAILSSEKQFFIEGEENILENNLTFTLIILDEGITLGNNNSLEDLTCEISKGAKLNIYGSLIYKNINESSWIMNQDQSSIEIQPDSSIKLYNSINLDKGQINFYLNSNLEKYEDKKITGPINAKGKIRQRNLS